VTEDAGHITAADVINAAAGAIEGITGGSLRPEDVERRAVEAMRETFGLVGADATDPLWSLHGDVCRQYLAAHGVSANELREWASVQQRFEDVI